MSKLDSFIPSSKVLREITCDIGFPRRNIILWFARYGAGKSSLLLDLAFDFAKQHKQKVLWIDTEGGMDIYIKLNEKMLKDKYGVKEDPIILKKIVDLKDIFKFFGMDVDFEISKEGMVNVKYYGDTKVPDEKDRRRRVIYSEASELIRKEDIGMMVIDSITLPFKSKFAGGREQLPGRSSAYSLLLTRVGLYTEELNLITFITAHESLVPSVNYEKPTAVGSSIMKYMSKFWYAIEKPAFSNPKMTGFRRIYLVRFPNVNDWSRKGVIEFTEKGIIDSSEKEIEERRKEIAKEK
jgi:RecA/RadA recombinase